MSLSRSKDPVAHVVICFSFCSASPSRRKFASSRGLEASKLSSLRRCDAVVRISDLDSRVCVLPQKVQK